MTTVEEFIINDLKRAMKHIMEKKNRLQKVESEIYLIDKDLKGYITLLEDNGKKIYNDVIMTIVDNSNNAEIMKQSLTESFKMRRDKLKKQILELNNEHEIIQKSLEDCSEVLGHCYIIRHFKGDEDPYKPKTNPLPYDRDNLMLLNQFQIELLKHKKSVSPYENTKIFDPNLNNYEKSPDYA